MTTRKALALGQLFLLLGVGCKSSPSQNSWFGSEDRSLSNASLPPEQLAQVEVQNSLAPLNQSPVYQLTDSDIGELSAESLLSDEERADLETLKAQN